MLRLLPAAPTPLTILRKYAKCLLWLSAVGEFSGCRHLGGFVLDGFSPTAKFGLRGLCGAPFILGLFNVLLYWGTLKTF